MVEIHMKDGDIYEAENIFYCGDKAYVIGEDKYKGIFNISEIKEVFKNGRNITQ